MLFIMQPEARPYGDYPKGVLKNPVSDLSTQLKWWLSFALQEGFALGASGAQCAQGRINPNGDKPGNDEKNSEQ